MAQNPKTFGERRLELHDILLGIMGGTGKVYFQPPENVKMEYPCIVYSLNTGDTSFADNIPYIKMLRWQLVYIDRNPDSNTKLKILDIPRCTLDRAYTADNLNHTSFNLYF